MACAIVESNICDGSAPNIMLQIQWTRHRVEGDRDGEIKRYFQCPKDKKGLYHNLSMKEQYHPDSSTIVVFLYDSNEILCIL